MRPLPSPFSTKVVGVSFVPGYPDVFFKLERRVLGRDLYDEGPVVANLVREPDNPHDANAVQVIVDGFGQVGHVPAPLAARIAPELDGGSPWEAEVIEVLVSPDNIANPGVTIEVRKREPEQ